MNTHLQKEYNLALIAMKAQGCAAVLNYYYTVEFLFDLPNSIEHS